MPAAVVIAAYLIGSIPFALIVARQRGTDLRQVGSGNLGAANVMRSSGVSAGAMVAALDMAKGAASVWLAAWASDGAELPALPLSSGMCIRSGSGFAAAKAWRPRAACLAC